MKTNRATQTHVSSPRQLSRKCKRRTVAEPTPRRGIGKAVIRCIGSVGFDWATVLPGETGADGDPVPDLGGVGVRV